MKTDFYIIRLQAGDYVGNIISGKNVKNFVRTTMQHAVRFNARAFADGFIKEYALDGATVEQTSEL